MCRVFDSDAFIPLRVSIVKYLEIVWQLAQSVLLFTINHLKFVITSVPRIFTSLLIKSDSNSVLIKECVRNLFKLLFNLLHIPKVEELARGIALQQREVKGKAATW